MIRLSKNDINIIIGVPPLALPDDRAAIDSEFFGMEKKRLHRPHGKFGALGVTYDGKNVYMILDQDKVPEFYEMIDPAVHIYQNALFDIMQLRRFVDIPERKRIWDTMLLEQIMYSGYYTDFALNDLARRYCGIYLPKEERKSFSIDSVMDDEKIFYTASDIVATWMVYQEQKKHVDDDDLKIWTQIDRPAMWALLSMHGVKVDTVEWIKMAESNQKTAEDLKSTFSFNPASPKQVKEALAAQGYDVDSTNEAVLESIQDDCELASDVLKYRKSAKLASTYGKDFVENYVESDGRIYSSYHLIGAETGRFSSSNPNLQNIPHGVEFRSKFICDTGKILVIADWSSQEPRNLAYLSQDEKLIEILNSGRDIYIEVGFEVFGERFEKGDERRSEMKAIVLGLSYGMSKYGLAAKLHKSEEYAEGLIEKFFSKFPGVKRYLDSQQKAKSFVTTIYGRKIWLNHFTNQWYRNALNAPIQGSAADAFKIAFGRFVNEWGSNPVVLNVHDEIVIEVDFEDGERAKQTLEQVMVQVAEEMHTGVKARVDVYLADSWAGKG